MFSPEENYQRHKDTSEAQRVAKEGVIETAGKDDELEGLAEEIYDIARDDYKKTIEEGRVASAEHIDEARSEMHEDLKQRADEYANEVENIIMSHHSFQNNVRHAKTQSRLHYMQSVGTERLKPAVDFAELLMDQYRRQAAGLPRAELVHDPEIDYDRRT